MRIYKHQWHDHDSVYFRNADGGVTVNIYPDGTAEIYDLIIWPESRGRGLGRLMLELAIQAAQIEHSQVMLVRPDCEPWVLAWLQRKGFHEDLNYEPQDGKLPWTMILR